MYIAIYITLTLLSLPTFIVHIIYKSLQDGQVHIPTDLKCLKSHLIFNNVTNSSYQTIWRVSTYVPIISELL